MPATLDPDEVRARLSRIGRRRRGQQRARADLVEATQEALDDARAVGIPITDAAKLVGIDRAVVYQHYGGGEDAQDSTG